MKNHIWLITALFIGLTLRLFLPWSNVFTGGHVNFVGVDSYYQAGLMRDMIVSGHFNFHLLYDAVIAGFTWIISFSHPSVNLIEHVSVFVPPVLGTLTILMAYIIARTLFNHRAALITAFVLAMFPGEFLARTYLGAIDYHCAEVFLTTAIIMCLVLLHKGYDNFKKLELDYYSVSYFFIPQVAFLIIVSIGLFIAYTYTWRPGYFLMAPVFMVLVFKKMWFLAPLLLIFIMIYATGYQSSITLSTTAEAMHGWFVLPVLLHIILALACVGYIVFSKIKGQIALINWIGLLVILALWQERFDYYLMVPLAIGLGFLIEKAWLALKAKIHFKTLAASSLLAVTLLVSLFVPYIASRQFYTPSQDWYSALTWLKIVSPSDSKVLAWWDYGYWIDYIAERKPMCNPGQGDDVIPVAKFLTCGQKVEGSPYIIIDKDTANDYGNVIEKWSQFKVYGHNFAWQLYNSEGINNFRLLYRNETVKIFKEAPLGSKD